MSVARPEYESLREKTILELCIKPATEYLRVPALRNFIQRTKSLLKGYWLLTEFRAKILRNWVNIQKPELFEV